MDPTRWTAMGSFAQALIIFSLPLSAIWAASNQDMTPQGSKSHRGGVIKDSIFSTVMGSVTLNSSGTECSDESTSDEKTKDVMVEEKQGGGYSNQV